jgi:26S proteasome regulatory subunit N1
MVERLEDPNPDIVVRSIQMMKEEIRSASGTMTSIPKPFKFLQAHFGKIKDLFEAQSQETAKKVFAGFMSLAATYLNDKYERDALRYLLQSSLEGFIDYGHQYLHSLSADIADEIEEREEKGEATAELHELARKIVARFMETSAEIDAIDFMLEIDKLEWLEDYADQRSFNKIFQYLTASSLYGADLYEIDKILSTLYRMAMGLGNYGFAVKVALKLADKEKVEAAFNHCSDPLIKKQLALELARNKFCYSVPDEELNTLISNSKLNPLFTALARELQVEDVKKPEQIYKSQLEERRHDIAESKKLNLADTYANAFVHCGYGKDALMLQTGAPGTSDPWIHKVANEGQTAATASIGMVNLWNIEEGINNVSDYMDLKDGFAKAGACIGVGIAAGAIITEVDPAMAVLAEQLDSKDQNVVIGAAIGLGMAYAGSERADVIELLTPVILNGELRCDASAFAALSLGLVCLGRNNGDASETIVQALMLRSEAKHLDMAISRNYVIGLALNFLGVQDRCEVALEMLETIEHPIMKYAKVAILSAAFIGSGNVLKVQSFLKITSAHLKEESKDSFEQAAAVLGIAFLAASEGIGNEMALRLMNQIYHFSDINNRRAIPLGLAILSLSNPKIQITDLLTKLAHDTDRELSQRALLALGLVGAVTNNSRLASILRAQASYYSKENDNLFFVRIAQGLLHMGKGLVSIQPYYSDKFLLNQTAMAGIFILTHAALDVQNIFHGKYHYMLYYLSLSIYPRMLYLVSSFLFHF